MMKKLKKKLLVAALCTMIASTAFCGQVLAAPQVNIGTAAAVSSNQTKGWPKGPDTTAETAVLMEASTGAVLYDKGMNELRYPASITKLMTLLVAAENSTLEEEVTFTETGIRDVYAGSGNIGMQLGEVMTMEQCMYAMIIYSANEVATQIAEHVGGTEEKFIQMMNDKAKELGCTNTHFGNASGLPNDEQVTTAYDMALIFRAGLQNEIFQKIISTPSYTIPATNKNPAPRELHTHLPMFAQESPFYYEGCIGGKTGYTDKAGHTLVAGAKKDGVTYIAVALRTQDLGYNCSDCSNLFNYGFENFTRQEISGGTVVLPKTVSKDKITQKGNDFYYGDYLVGTSSPAVLIGDPTPTPVPEPTNTPMPEKKQESKGQQEINSRSGTTIAIGNLQVSVTMIVLLGIFAVMVLVLIILSILLAKKKKRNKRRHRR